MSHDEQPDPLSDALEAYGRLKRRYDIDTKKTRDALFALVACIRTSAADEWPDVAKGSIMSRVCKEIVKTGQFADAEKVLDDKVNEDDQAKNGIIDCPTHGEGRDVACRDCLERLQRQLLDRVLHPTGPGDPELQKPGVARTSIELPPFDGGDHGKSE